jgi:hypothetical protein
MQVGAITFTPAPSAVTTTTLIAAIKMSSEDDTFRVLSRPSLIEMRQLYIKMTKNPQWTIGDRDQLFVSHGWTLREFVTKSIDGDLNLPHD